MVQESLRIEVPVEHVDAVRDHFYLVFSEGVDENFPVTGHMEFIPKRLSAKISKKMLCNWACKQNQWCTSLEHFTLRGTHNIDMNVRRKDGRMTTLRKELVRTKDAEGNSPIQMAERATYNRVYLVHEKHNRELVAQIGTGLDNFLKSIFPQESILVLRELESTGYFGESGTHSEFASKFEEKFSRSLEGENFAPTASRPPLNI